MNFIRQEIFKSSFNMLQHTKINFRISCFHRKNYCILRPSKINACNDNTCNSSKSLLKAIPLHHNISFKLPRRFCSAIENPKVVTSHKLQNINGQKNSSENVNNDNNVIDVDLHSVGKQFPQPKSILNNFYAMVSNEMKNADLKITTHYKPVKRNKTTPIWKCTYHVKWPEDIQFTYTASSKQEASHRVSLMALSWLKRLKKINASGQPIIDEPIDVKNLKKNHYSVLKLSVSSQQNLKDVIDIYDKDLASKFALKDDAKDAEEVVEKYENIWPESKQSNHSYLQAYTACEPVVLPITSYKSKINELVDNHQIVIIKGEPGCGKSTRVPQYILEAWSKNSENNKPARIIVTQPRRIAAISLAERVADERDEMVGNIVGYQVRLHSKFNNNTGRILYCTTGILLRRMQTDPELKDCTHIILDEAHERDVNTDLLMNLLRQALEKNPNLKVVIMSATIDTNMFQEYFKNAGVIHIPGFAYPVGVKFLEDIKGIDLSKTKKMCSETSPYVVCEDVVKVINRIHKIGEEGAILCFLPGWEEISRIKRLLGYSRDKYVLCLHSRLQDNEQRKIFASLPPGVRKIILATNIAETSVTVNDVRYVIDTGIHKEHRFDSDKGVMCIDNHWISQASMIQRKGRAGRVQKGTSYHLYTNSKYNDFAKYSVPEILRMSLTKIILDGKVYSNNMDAIKFLQELPCPPDKNVVIKGLEELKELELLDNNENLTPLGRTVSDFQLEPKLSKAMINSVIFKCATPIVDIVTLFSAETELFTSGLIDKENVKNIKCKYSETSDHLSMMRIFEHWLEYINDKQYYQAEEFCLEHNLAEHKLRTIAKLRQIHFDYLYKGLYDIIPISDDFSDSDELIKSVLLSGVGNLLEHRNWDISKGRIKKTSVLLTRHKQKASITSDSINHKRTNFPSNFLMYINETRSNIRRTTIIRESSLMSSLSVLLFKNKDLHIETIPKEEFSPEIDSDDQVALILDGTKTGVICDREQAIQIQSCKNILKKGADYFVHQLTTGRYYDGKLNESWKNILAKIENTLSTNSIS